MLFESVGAEDNQMLGIVFTTKNFRALPAEGTFSTGNEYIFFMQVKQGIGSGTLLTSAPQDTYLLWSPTGQENQAIAPRRPACAPLKGRLPALSDGDSI